jgi:hypothetical protein
MLLIVANKKGAPNIPAGIAQLVEQRTENPRVTGSSPVPGIILKALEIIVFQGFFAF